MTLPAPQAKAFDPVTAAIVGGLAIGTIGAAAATNAAVHPGWGYAYAPAPAFVPETRAYAYEPAPVWRTRRVVRTHVAPRRVYVAPRRRVVHRVVDYPDRWGPSYGPTVNVGFGFGAAHPGWW